ncbi:MAG: type II toxin-antitoxin system YafQ family toxin [Chitinophagaceae bacterium]|jgi:mRNA interferase YafQ|nr:type II toxin-antitoxin system YafQ family toxin [Chitinophagaceae bacterium]
MNKEPNQEKIPVKVFFERLSKIENALYDVDYTNAFKKNIKLCYKRNLDLQLLVNAIEILVQNGFLPAHYKPHPIKMYNCMECHIAPDWLLLWKQNENDLILVLTNTGTHSDLLGM